MAEKKKAGVDPETLYMVKVKRPVRVGESFMTPTTQNPATPQRPQLPA
jgi:hypothetical protein